MCSAHEAQPIRLIVQRPHIYYCRRHRRLRPFHPLFNQWKHAKLDITQLSLLCRKLDAIVKKRMMRDFREGEDGKEMYSATASYITEYILAVSAYT